jgi:CRP-like cAMP-binding protein
MKRKFVSFSISPVRATNRLLWQLPAQDYRRILPRLELVPLKSKQNLCQQNLAIEYVYFPLDTVVSHAASTKDGVCIHVGAVGPEGMIGLPAFLGFECARFTAVALVTGRALRIGVSEFRFETGRSPALIEIIHRYTEVFLMQLALEQACARLHSIEQRFICWLLKIRRSSSSGGFEVTQDFLSELLGIRRAGISQVASALQRAGLIRYSRGKLTVVDEHSLDEGLSMLRGDASRICSLRF